MDPQVRTELERLDELIARVGNAASAGSEALALAKNRVQQQSLSGAVVAAAGAITPDGALTTVGPLGKIRISANVSGQPAVGATVRPILQVKIGGGAFTTVYDWQTVTGVAATGADFSVVFEFDSAAVAGTILTVHWQTTAGDGTYTLGGAAGAGINGATLLIEEIP